MGPADLPQRATLPRRARRPRPNLSGARSARRALAHAAGVTHARAMRRTWVLAIAAGCSAAPRATPAGGAPGVVAGSQPVASSAGSSAPWPAPTSVPASSLRLQTRPLPHDLVQLRTVGDVAISPDGARVAYTVRAPRFDPAAKPAPDDARAGWKVETQ